MEFLWFNENTNSMKRLLKIAGAALLVGIILFAVIRSKGSDKEVIIKVKASKSASYTGHDSESQARQEAA